MIMNEDIKKTRFYLGKHNIVNIEMFKEFQLKYPEYDITYNTFFNIIRDFNIKLYRKISEDPNGYELPRNIGFMIVTAVKKKKKSLDYRKKNPDGSFVAYDNKVTNDCLCKIMYSNYDSKYRLKDKGLWVFKACQKFQRYASLKFKEDYKKYIELSPREKLDGFVNDKERNREVIPVRKINYSIYNEFNI